MEIGGPVEERDPARDSMRESSVTQVLLDTWRSNLRKEMLKIL